MLTKTKRRNAVFGKYPCCDLINKLFCKHEYVLIRILYGDEINLRNGKRNEYRCKKCGMYKWM